MFQRRKNCFEEKWILLLTLTFKVGTFPLTMTNFECLKYFGLSHSKSFSFVSFPNLHILGGSNGDFQGGGDLMQIDGKL